MEETRSLGPYSGGDATEAPGMVSEQPNDAPALATAKLLREFADLFERKRKGFAVLLVVRDSGEVAGYVAEAEGLLPERIKEALAQPYDLNLIANEDTDPTAVSSGDEHCEVAGVRGHRPKS